MRTGIIPAGGKAERMGGAHKFLLPCTGHKSLLHKMIRDMLEVMDRVVVLPSLDNYGVIEAGIGDINDPRLVIERVFGDTPNQAVGRLVNLAPYKVGSYLLAMPDTYFTDSDVYSRMMVELDSVMNTRMVVGVWHTEQKWLSKRGVVDYASTFVEGSPVVAAVRDKPRQNPKKTGWAWGALSWKSGVNFLVSNDHNDTLSSFINRVVDGFSFGVRAVEATGRYFDLGTLDEMREAYNYMEKL